LDPFQAGPRAAAGLVEGGCSNGPAAATPAVIAAASAIAPSRAARLLADMSISWPSPELLSRAEGG
jgi:hypothetical protein